MTQQDYEQKKQEQWLAYAASFGVDPTDVETRNAFSETFNNAFALGKQFGNSEQVAETTLNGWICRDKDGILALFRGESKPYKQNGNNWWSCDYGRYTYLGKNRYPDITWESEPLPVKIKIERNNG